VSNIWIHTFFVVTVAVATVDVPPVEKIVVAMTLVVSHIVFDIIPHGHLSHLKLMSVKKSYLVEAWSGLLIIPLVTWYLAECNFFGYLSVVMPLICSIISVSFTTILKSGIGQRILIEKSIG